MRRSVTESLLLVTMLYFVMPNAKLSGRVEREARNVPNRRA